MLQTVRVKRLIRFGNKTLEILDRIELAKIAGFDPTYIEGWGQGSSTYGKVANRSQAGSLRRTPGRLLRRMLASVALRIVFQPACRLGCEGIVSKRLGSRYRSGR
jgi:hypothetical protein